MIRRRCITGFDGLNNARSHIRYAIGLDEIDKQGDGNQNKDSSFSSW